MPWPLGDSAKRRMAALRVGADTCLTGRGGQRRQSEEAVIAFIRSTFRFISVSQSPSLGALPQGSNTTLSKPIVSSNSTDLGSGSPSQIIHLAG